MSTLFAVAVTILLLGFLWFYVARPILEDFGVIRVEGVPESVNHSQEVMSPVARAEMADQQTDEADGPADKALSVDRPKPPRFALDRTRQAVLEELLTHGWTITDLRREGIFRGDNTAIGQEVAETRQRLGLADPERTLKVRDASGERVIPY